MSIDIIVLAADHAGYAMKAALAADLHALGYQLLDLGTGDGETSVDYPDFGHAIAQAVADGRAGRGVAVCGSGIGIAIAANRNPAARAALCTSGLMARMARLHNDANILVLGSRIIGIEAARDCLNEFLTTDFAGGRHAARVDKLRLQEAVR